ncbi:hypothetical protein LTS18_010045 [Coniosporium uncinatum]|uniref:Uncharacterized protein n=1 Tax=Coniosporium uncinatum TaxID=93489 RepID=A0ACC3D0B9_9PEZI|nr:hypothetical protein LTS18_010045 [Coniosporium uncinatum]
MPRQQRTRTAMPTSHSPGRAHPSPEPSANPNASNNPPSGLSPPPLRATNTPPPPPTSTMSKPPASLLTLPRELRQPLLLHLIPSDSSLSKYTPTSLITHAMSFYDLHPVLATDMKWVLAQWQQRHQEMWKVYSARRRGVRAVARELVEEVEKRRVGVGIGLTRGPDKEENKKREGEGEG